MNWLVTVAIAATSLLLTSTFVLAWADLSNRSLPPTLRGRIAKRWQATSAFAPVFRWISFALALVWQLVPVWIVIAAVQGRIDFASGVVMAVELCLAAALTLAVGRPSRT